METAGHGYSLEALQNILNGIDAMVYATVPDTGEILFINDSMRQHYNLDEDVVGRICYEVLQDGMDEKCDFCPCFRLEREPDSVVKWEEHSTLTKRTYRNTDRYIDWINGEKIHVQQSIDITDMKITEERLMIMLDSSPLCAQIWDRNLNTIDCNKAAVELYGFKSKQEYRERFIESCSPEFQPDGRRSDEKAVELVHRAFEEGYLIFDWMHKMPDDDTLIPAEVILARSQYMDDDVVIGYTRDMRVHHMLMKAIARRDNLLQSVNQAAALLLTTKENENIEASLMASMELVGRSIDADRIHIWRNEVVDGEMFFIHAYEWLSDTGRQKTVVPKGSMTPYKNFPHWIEKFGRNEYVGGSRSFMKPEDVAYFHGFDVMSVVLIPLYLDDEFWGLFSVDDCVNERDYTEDEINILRSVSLMMASAVNRQALVEKRTQELAALKEEADLANKAKSSFLANMSHEIRTPMNSILGVTDILLQKESIPHDIEDGLNRIFSSCNTLLGIINDILDFSKIEAGQYEIASEEYSVVHLIKDSVEMNMGLLQDRPIEFELHVDEHTPVKLIGDELRIKQILTNLLSNAFKYTETGKVKLTVVSEPWESRDGITLIFAVRDTGCGMTEEQMQRLFEEYTRFNKDSGGAIEGTGLGLAITQRLIEIMQGGINVESEVGVGSLFVVKLPQKIVSEEVIGNKFEDYVQQERMNYVTRKRRSQIIHEPMPYGSVMIVDDMETNLYVAIGLLRPYGLRINTVLNGQDAIDIVKKGNVYDIVFMDHMMPEPDGIETTKAMRELGYKAPIVALTANALAGQAEMFLKNGFDDYISKPIDIRQLDATLKKLIRDKQPAKVIEEAYLQQNKSKSKSDDKSKQKMESALRGAFIRDARKAVAVLENLCKENNWADNDENIKLFTVTVHGAKSSLASIGEKELSTAAENLEIGGRDKNAGLITVTAPGFIKKLQKTLDLLEKGSTDDQRDTSDSNENLRDKMMIIKNLCADYDRKAIMDILSKINKPSDDAKESLEKIKQLVLHSKFDEAEKAAEVFASELKL